MFAWRKQACLDSQNHFPVTFHCHRILPSFSHSPPLNASDNFLSIEMYSEGPLDEIFIDQGKDAVEIHQQTFLKEYIEEWLERKYR